MDTIGEWGRGYRGTNGRRHMGTNYYWGNGGGATGALVGGDTWVLTTTGGMGAGLQGH